MPHNAAVPKPALRIIPPTEPGPVEQVRQRLRSAPKPAAMLQCNRCAGRELIETKTGVLFKNGKPTGGTRQMLCVSCLARGERVVIA